MVKRLGTFSVVFVYPLQIDILTWFNCPSYCFAQSRGGKEMLKYIPHYIVDTSISTESELVRFNGKKRVTKQWLNFQNILCNYYHTLGRGVKVLD